MFDLPVETKNKESAPLCFGRISWKTASACTNFPFISDTVQAIALPMSTSSAWDTWFQKRGRFRYSRWQTNSLKALSTLLARRQNRHPPHPFNWNFSENQRAEPSKQPRSPFFCRTKSNEMTDIKGRMSPNTVSHFNRASNHNRWSNCSRLQELFLISIEHQITTLVRELRRRSGLFLISIEHQITTDSPFYMQNIELFLISIEHQITTIRCQRLMSTYCFSFQ